jgi:uncharacterized protein YkwD
MTEVEQELLDRINKARTAKRRRKLQAHPALAAAAAAHSADLASHGLCQHDGSDGSTVQDRVRRQGYSPVAVAENLAFGAESPAQVVSLWLKSDAHRDNLLGKAYAHAGVAVATGSAGPSPVWTLVLGAGTA